MSKILNFALTIFLTLIAVAVIKSVIAGIDLEGIGATEVEIAMWEIMPVAILISLFIVSLTSLVRGYKKKEEKK